MPWVDVRLRGVPWPRQLITGYLVWVDIHPFRHLTRRLGGKWVEGSFWNVGRPIIELPNAAKMTGPARISLCGKSRSWKLDNNILEKGRKCIGLCIYIWAHLYFARRETCGYEVLILRKLSVKIRTTFEWDSHSYELIWLEYPAYQSRRFYREGE